MKKLLNTRYPFLIMIGVAAGIVTAVSCIYGKFFQAVLVVAAFALTTLLFCVKSKKLPIIIFAAISCVLGVASTLLFSFSLDRERIYCDEKVVVTGYVSYNPEGEDSDYFVLRRPTVTFPDGTERKLRYDVSARLFYKQSPAAGSVVSAEGILTNAYVFRDKVTTYRYKNGTMYGLKSVKILSETPGDLTFRDAARKYVHDTFNSRMAENSELAFALFTGDKSGVSEQTLVNFRQAGISHVLAVSGLHVGFIVAVFNFVLKKMGAKPKVRMAVILPPLIFYAWIVASASVVRAVIMAAFMLFAQVLYRRNDLLNSMSVAATAILLFCPIMLFDAGFLLSFGAVFGIATVSLPLNRKIMRKFDNEVVVNLLSLLSVSLGATLGTLCQCVYYFREISITSLLTNVVAVPLVSVAFVCLFIGIIPHMGWILSVSDWVLTAIRVTAGMLSVAVRPTVTVVAAALLFAALFVMGQYINFKPTTRRIVAAVLCVLCVFCAIFALIPTSESGQEVFLLDSDGGPLAAFCDGEGNWQVLCSLSRFSDAETLAEFLSQRKVASLNLYICDYGDSSVSAAEKLCKSYVPDGVYLFGSETNEQTDAYFTSLGVSVIYVPQHSSASGNARISVIYDDAPVACSVDFRGAKFLFVLCEGDLLADVLPELPLDFSVVWCDYSSQILRQTYSGAAYFCNEELFGEDIYSILQCGNFTIQVKSGKISVTKGIGAALW